MPRKKKEEGYELRSLFHKLVGFDFKPYTDFYTENMYNFTSNDIYMKAIRHNGKIVGVLTRADEKYLYGVIDLSAVMVNLTIDTDLSVEDELRDKYEKICQTLTTELDGKKEISDSVVFATQKRIPMMDRYEKYNKVISQKDTSSDDVTCEEYEVEDK